MYEKYWDWGTGMAAAINNINPYFTDQPLDN